MENIVFNLASFVTNIIGEIGYLGITLLMAIESSFIPFPSEIVIPPAAYLAHSGQFNLWLVILAGTLGSLIGALVNYFLALFLGRKLIYFLADTKAAKIILINPEKLKKAEDYFLKYGNISTFLGRLLPAIRQLISIPAGFSRMSLSRFVFYTGLGSGFWVFVLALLGYFFGANQEKLENYYHLISWLAVAFVIILFLFIFIKKRRH